MSRKITIIQGHPDPDTSHYGYALAAAYADGARGAGHDVREIVVGPMEFPFLSRRDEFYGENVAPLPVVAPAQADIFWADHIVIFFPLWYGGMPAKTKGFIEQVFVGSPADNFEAFTHLLKGKSGRIVVTMGMPAQVFRWYFGAAGVRTLEQGILRLMGMGPIRESLIGQIDNLKPEQRERWLSAMRSLGSRAA